MILRLDVRSSSYIFTYVVIDDDDDRIMIPSRGALYLVTSCITFNVDWIK
jgi:hypothetical protein